MSKSRIIWLGLLALAGSILAIWVGKTRLASEVTLPQPAMATDWVSVADHQLVPLQLADRVLTVEVVKTPASITQGLSGRAELGADGMLFILPRPEPATFWMKDMQFDLDLVWVRNQTVVAVTEQVPHPSPGTPDGELPTYTAGGVVDMVLEIPAGRAADWSIARGTQLQFLLPK